MNVVASLRQHAEVSSTLLLIRVFETRKLDVVFHGPNTDLAGLERKTTVVARMGWLEQS